MKLCFIPPLKHLDLSLKGDMLFLLAQQAFKYSDYVEFYKNQEKYKILDNGIAEKQQVKPEVLLDMAKEIKADEIIVPDKLYTGWRTTFNFKQFIEIISKEEIKKYKLQVVPQGKDKEQFMRCLDNILQYGQSQNVVIGISKFSAPKCFGNRVRCVEHLLHQRGIKNQLHLLGTTSNIAEVGILKKYPSVRSNDSCVPILSASKGVKFDQNIGNLVRIPTSNEYFDVVLDGEQITIAKHNMDVMKQIAN